MRNPLVQAWLYLGVGLVGVLAASVYLWLDAANPASRWATFDWILLALGAFGVYYGARLLYQHKKKPPQSS
jgi:hypothetical protein